jgi:signal peptidase II
VPHLIEFQQPRTYREAMKPLLVAMLVVAVDQIAKRAVVAAIGPGADRQRIELVGDALALDYLENSGVAFGLFGGRGLVAAALASLALLALVVGYVKAGSGSAVRQVGAGLVVGGAVGNLLDRLRLGYVVDFIDLGPWPTFNVADAAVTVGVVLLVWAMTSSELHAGESPAETHRIGHVIEQSK